MSAYPSLRSALDNALKGDRDAYEREARDLHGRWTKLAGLVHQLDSDPSYVPTKQENADLHAARDVGYSAAAAVIREHVPWDEGGQTTLGRRDTLERAARISRERRAKAGEAAAATAAQGGKMDTSMFSGTMEDYLKGDQLAKFRELVNDPNLTYPDKVGTYPRVYGYERANELDSLKYTAMSGMMEKAGLPHNAAWNLAGRPGEETAVRFAGMGNPDDPDTAEKLVSDWSTSGARAGGISTWYDHARTMPPPEVRPDDFAGGVKTKVHNSPGYGPNPVPLTYETKGWQWDDNSPATAARRRAASEYWIPRAQQFYTQTALKELKNPPGDEMPVMRMVYDADHSIRNAAAANQPWQAATRSLSSWATPSKRAGNTIDKFITQDMGISHPIWMKNVAPTSSVFMHWRTEGQLRNSVKALGEVVLADEKPSNLNTTISTEVPA
jgi:hypothetical protein